MFFDKSHRSFFWLLVKRDLKMRYAGSTLGGLWNLIHPLMMILIYMTVFSSIMRQKYALGVETPYYGALSYGVHLVAGLLPWLVFSEVLTRTTGILVENSMFLKKTSLPPLALYFSVLFNSLLINGVGFLCFWVLLAILGLHAPLMALAGLGVMFLLGLTATGFGLILSGINVFLRDTAQVVGIILQLLFWFMPIVYYKDRFFTHSPEDASDVFFKIGKIALNINPLEPFIASTQWMFGHGVSNPAPTWVDWALIFGFPIIMCSIGIFLFRRMLPDVRDCL